eukprot:16039-Heterococcus_DN1.PRE.5
MQCTGAVPGVTPFASAVKFQKRSGTGAHGLYVVVFAIETMVIASKLEHAAVWCNYAHNGICYKLHEE